MSGLPRNIATVYAAHGLNGIVGVIAVPLVLKLLGTSGYGLLSIYTLLSAYVLIADLGIGKNLLRILAESTDPERQLNNFRTAFGLYILLAAAWFALCPALVVVVPRFLFPVPSEYLTALRSMTVLATVEFALGIPASLMQTACVARQRFTAYAGYSMATGLTRNGALIGAALITGSPVAVASALAARKVIDSWIAYRILGGLPRVGWRPVFDLAGFKSMLARSTVLSTALILNFALTFIGSPLVNASFGLDALGVYRSAFDLAGKIAFVSNGVTMVVFPRAARYYATALDLRRSRTIFGVVLRCSSIAYLLFAGSAIVIAPWLLPAIGLTNKTAIALFLLLIIGLSLNAHSLLGNELVQAAGRYRYSVYFNLCGLITFAALFVTLSPAVGLMAIGWAWIGAALTSSIVGDAFVLSLGGSKMLDHIRANVVKLIAIGACLGLVMFHFGAVDLRATVLCGAVLAGMLGFAVREVMCERSRESLLAAGVEPATTACAG